MTFHILSKPRGAGTFAWTLETEDRVKKVATFSPILAAAGVATEISTLGCRRGCGIVNAKRISNDGSRELCREGGYDIEVEPCQWSS